MERLSGHIMKAVGTVIAAAVMFLPISAACQESSGTAASQIQGSTVFREPFTLTIQVDAQHRYVERYEKRIPYMAGKDVYLFSGEKFGINLKADGYNVVDVTYQPDVTKADVSLEFSQPKDLGGASMMLVIQNHLKNELHMEALMTVPGKKGIYKTSILPVAGGLSNFESWPHPIVQLVLRNFQLSENPEIKPKKRCLNGMVRFRQLAKFAEIQ